MNMSWNHSVDSNQLELRMIIEKSLEKGSIIEAIALAKSEIAKKIWEENADKIMAEMDLKGLANLIAIHASEALKK